MFALTIAPLWIAAAGIVTPKSAIWISPFSHTSEFAVLSPDVFNCYHR
jgi:hypothetical protein